MKYKLAIFDMDGTILSTLDDLANAVDFALKAHNLPARSKNQTRKALGRGVRFLIEQSVPGELTEEKISAVERSFLEYYREHNMDNTKPYDGIVDVIKKIRSKGIKTAVISNKIDDAVRLLCDNFFAGVFDKAVGERPGVPVKPHPEAVNTIIECMGASKNETVYIGDSEVDLLTAKNAEIDHIIVTWGFRDRDFLSESGAEVFAENMAELEAQICI